PEAGRDQTLGRAVEADQIDAERQVGIARGVQDRRAVRTPLTVGVATLQASDVVQLLGVLAVDIDDIRIRVSTGIDPDQEALAVGGPPPGPATPPPRPRLLSGAQRGPHAAPARVVITFREDPSAAVVTICKRDALGVPAHAM